MILNIILGLCIVTRVLANCNRGISNEHNINLEGLLRRGRIRGLIRVVMRVT